MNRLFFKVLLRGFGGNVIGRPRLATTVVEDTTKSVE